MQRAEIAFRVFAEVKIVLGTRKLTPTLLCHLQISVHQCLLAVQKNHDWCVGTIRRFFNSTARNRCSRYHEKLTPRPQGGIISGSGGTKSKLIRSGARGRSTVIYRSTLRDETIIRFSFGDWLGAANLTSAVARCHSEGGLGC